MAKRSVGANKINVKLKNFVVCKLIYMLPALAGRALWLRRQ